MKKSLDLSTLNLKPLSLADLQNIDGGFVPYILNHALLLATFGVVGAVIYASFEKGYQQACGYK